MTAGSAGANVTHRVGSPLEVLLAFGRLGLTSFGGPIAHLGYFHQQFVVRRRWIDEHAYADLVALCQFLPGPASSQVGFALGLLRAGALGGMAAWIGFTLPSAAALVAFAHGARSLGGPLGTGALHGLKLVAVAIVAQAVWGMARSLCPDRTRASIATAAALLVLGITASLAQIAAIAAGAAAGLLFCRAAKTMPDSFTAVGVPRSVGLAALACFFLLLLGMPALQGLGQSQAIDLFSAFYRSGALVFGGGHVVLPLLQQAVVAPGWMGEDAFVSGYGAAQAVPGPLFSVAAYLGAVVGPAPNGLIGAAIALFGIFLPGLLLLVGVLPFWAALRRRSGIQAMMRGVNAAVVGLLAAALYDPLWTSAIRQRTDFAIVLIAFILLTVWRAPPLLVVSLCALAGVLLGL